MTAKEVALSICQTLNSHGFDAFLAGGCVRDLCLGISPKDFDVATSATPTDIAALFPVTIPVGAHFGVSLVVIDGHQVEVATFRTDGTYLDGRRPESVTFSKSYVEDVKRRDFTINGLLMAPDSKDVIDIVGGLKDLEDGLIRAIGDATERFKEDGLRMLRAVRFAARFDFEIETETAEAIRQLAPTIHKISNERILVEMTTMLLGSSRKRALELLSDLGLLKFLLPEVEALKGVQQPPDYHPEGDVWTHTILALELLEDPSPTLVWATLLHDIGKPACYDETSGRIRFLGHDKVGAEMVRDICNRLKFSNEQKDTIISLVANHMRFYNVKEMKPSTLKRFFRLPAFDEQLELQRVDSLAASGDLSFYEYAKEKYESMPDDVVKPALLVTGRDLIDAGYVPEPAFKTILYELETMQLDGEFESKEDGLKVAERLFAQKK